MEIRIWQCYFVINCALIYCGVAKTVSLNDVIAAESQQKQFDHTTIPAKLEDRTAEHYSVNRILKPITQKRKKSKDSGKRNNLKLSESITALRKNFSPLKYRKTFQIKSPLKPKRVKPSIRSIKKQNIQAKREINENVNLKRKYIPLLKSLSMLFDNIIGPDSNESFEAKRRTRYYSGENDEATCKCSTRAESSKETDSKDETNSAPETFSFETSTATETPAETTNITTTGNIRSFRQNKNIPILFPRNTISPRRDDNGLSEGSSATDNGSFERNISWNNGNSEHNTNCRPNESCAERDEENTDNDSRYSSSSFRTRNRVRHRINTEDLSQGNLSEETDNISKTESENATDFIGGNFNQLERETKLQIGRVQTKSTTVLPKFAGRLRGFVPEDEISSISDTIQTQENDEDSIVDDTYNYSRDQRVTNGNSTHTQENKKSSDGNETVITIPTLQIPTNARKQGPVVVIIDGYSVTRHRNGENKLSEKSVHIHS